MSPFVLAVVAFLIVLGPLILIHELGHFIAARLIGVTVLEFGIGFPPRAIKLFEQGGTEFTLNWLPIGGFVRPLGEDFVRPVGDAATDEERAAFEKRQTERTALEERTIKTKSIAEAGPWQRIFFMSAGMGMNFLAGFILFTIVALTGVPVLQSAHVTAGTLTANSAAAQAGFQPGDVITSLNRQAVASTFDLEMALCKQSVAGSVLLGIQRDGQAMTLTLPPASVPMGGVLLQSVSGGEPAARAGLQVGDRIVQVDGQPMCNTNDLFAYEGTKLGQQVTFGFVRNGQLQTLPVTLNPHMPAIGAEIANQSAAAGYGVQVSDQNPVFVNQPQPLGTAMQQGLSDTWGVVQTTINVPAQLLRGTLSLQDAHPVSVVGISQMGAQVIQSAIDEGQSYPILRFAAVISVAIGLTQLIPIPGLDGGRILFVIIELLRGKPMKPEREGMVHLIGLMLLLGFMLIFVVNDLINPVLLPH